MNKNNDSLLPPDSMVSNISTEDWFLLLKPHFTDLIWEYYSNRVVFVDDRFLLEADDTSIINNILRSFAICLKTKSYEFKKLHDTTLLEYNPIWNVDGVTGTIHEQTYEGNSTDSKSGSDITTHSGDDTLKRTGTDTTQKTGTDTHNTIASHDAENSYETDQQQFVNTYDSIDYDPPAEYPSEHMHEQKDDVINEDDTDNTTITYNTTETTTHNTNDKNEYNSESETTYDTTNEGSTDHFQQDLDLVIRQGNIGVTTTQHMINEEREVALFDFFKHVVHECVNTCTYAVE